jgi:ABC-2 type transport system permease protein
LPRDPVGFVLAFGLGMSSLFAIALGIAAVVPTASTASAVGLPVFFAVMFLGGVYVPRFLLPDLIVQIGNLTPPGVQGLQDAWLGAPLQILPLVIMATITVVAGTIAIRTFRWE